MVLWFLRHAATDENLAHRMIGRTDVALGEAGVKQATALGQRLRDVPFEAVYTSPLARARETASLVSSHNAYSPPIISRDDLQEIHLGIFEGQPAADVYTQHRDMMDRGLDRSIADFAFPEGELRSDAARRFHRAVIGMIQYHSHTGESVVPTDTAHFDIEKSYTRIGKYSQSADAAHCQQVAVVTHGSVFGCWLAYVRGLPLGAFWDLQPKHASLTKITAVADTWATGGTLGDRWAPPDGERIDGAGLELRARAGGAASGSRTDGAGLELRARAGGWGFEANGWRFRIECFSDTGHLA